MQDFECKKKMKENYLDGLDFAMVFLWAKYASAAVPKTLFWTPDILFKIDLGVTTPGTINVYKLVENWYSSHPCAIFRKTKLKTGRFHQKSEF